ncbi:hypothetical protein ASF18_12945 [Methylobacterium sp. Leaf89]|nr:hypothetical protein ASF18_12945 [Methylobacterium sp. Leaf89]
MGGQTRKPSLDELLDGWDRNCFRPLLVGYFPEGVDEGGGKQRARSTAQEFVGLRCQRGAQVTLTVMAAVATAITESADIRGAAHEAAGQAAGRPCSLEGAHHALLPLVARLLGLEIREAKRLHELMLTVSLAGVGGLGRGHG